MKPILFNTEMVRAILDGRKTVTRRVVKLKYGNTHIRWLTNKYGTQLVEIQNDIEGETHGKNPNGSTWRKLLGCEPKKPPYRKGDILYVRETYRTDAYVDGRYEYRATPTCEEKVEEYDRPARWRPSIHMPREAARIFLRVTDVRVERLQEITAQGIRDEGLTSGAVHCGDMEIASAEFALLWDSIVKKQDLDRYDWNANPWVWVIEFERCHE